MTKKYQIIQTILQDPIYGTSNISSGFDLSLSSSDYIPDYNININNLTGITPEMLTFKK